LLSGQCDLFGLDEGDWLSFVIGSRELALISVVGRPDKQAILEAVANNHHRGVLLAAPDGRDYVAQALPDWTAGLAWLHLLKDASRLPPTAGRAVRLIALPELEAIVSLPPDLKEELTAAARRSAVAATFAGGIPVSFCYAGAQTESLWDISIDTLPGYRNQGYAAVCVAYMIEYMNQRGKQPVWGAEESNVASLSLAAKLGFAAVDQLIVFQHQAIGDAPPE
jgi:GNAT superfamily N-acetyltransferase